MSDETRTRMAENTVIASQNIGFAASALESSNFVRFARFMGRAAAAIEICMADAIDLAPVPSDVRTAFDDAMAGIGE